MRGLNLSAERGYKPSSDLQAKFSTYHETLNVCLQNLMRTYLANSIVLLPKCVYNTELEYSPDQSQ